MSDTTPPNVAATAAPASTLPPTSQQPATPTTAPADGKEPKHPGTSKLWRAFQGLAPEEEPVKKATDAPVTKEPTPKKEGEGKEPVAKEKPIGVRKKPGPKPPELPVPAAKKAAASAAVAPTPAAAPAPGDATVGEEDLTEAERQYLSDAKELEAMDPKYKGMGAKAEKYIKEQIKFVEAHGGDIDINDPEFLAWQAKNKPKITQREWTDLAVHRRTSKMQQESDKKLQNVEHQLYVRDEEPKVRSEATQMYIEMARSSIPDEVKAEVSRLQKEMPGKTNQEVFERAKENYALEIEVSEQILTEATADMEEFIRLTRNNPKTGKPLKDFDPNNPQHVRCSEIVGEVCEDFKRNTRPEKLYKDGKWFATRDEYNAMDADDRAKWWTLSNPEILAIARTKVKPVIAAAIDERRKQFSKYGFVRQVRTGTPPPAPQQKNEPRAPMAGAPPPAGNPSPIPAITTPPSDGISQGAKTLAAAFNRGPQKE